ncbi:MAG: hypothetical protein IPP63_17260 [Chloracidobacterium sp.]|nr:hypothetical protein [Chloracidobacterium sp.]
MSTRKLIIASIFAFSAFGSLPAQNRSNEPIPAMPKMLTQLEQMNVREQWLENGLGSCCCR